MPIFPTHPVPDIIPNNGLICYCSFCKENFRVTKWSDFTHGPQFIGTVAEKQDALYIICPICKNHPATPLVNMDQRIVTYELWKLSAGPRPTWEKTTRCPECKFSEVITVDNIVVINTSTSANGWNPQVLISCPICFSQTPADGRIPSGVSDFAIDLELEKQNK